MMIHVRRTLALSIFAAACGLSACKEPQPPADFSPEAGQASTATPAAGAPLVEAPVELTYDQRRVALVPGLRCNLERVNGTTFAGAPVPVSKDEGTRFSGWLADVEAKQAPAEFDLRFVNVDSKRVWKANAKTGGARQDVQTLLGGDAALAATGYLSELDLGPLPDGTYRVYAVFQKNGQFLSCDNGRSIVIGS